MWIYAKVSCKETMLFLCILCTTIASYLIPNLEPKTSDLAVRKNAPTKDGKSFIVLPIAFVS